MKILVLNAGSSSIKLQIFQNDKSLANALIEQIGEDIGHITLSFTDKKIKKELFIKNHHEAILNILDLLNENDIVKSFDEFDGVGHRVVHGGELFSKSVIIDKASLKKLKKISPLAPLHNPSNVDGIEVCMNINNKIPNIAVFDTAFHQSMPKSSFLYALPYELYEKYSIRRYGFHGTSHEYVMQQAQDILGKKEVNIITAHLGNGASVCAIKNSKSIDTSMGFTPLEGLIMGTRSGDIDPSIITYLQKQNISIEEIENILNKKSGLKGICNINDMREILDNIDNELVKIAFDMFALRIKKYIGSYMALLGEVDGIVFTGGIGENAPQVRESVCENMSIFGIELNKEANNQNKQIISTSSSKTKIMKINTNEELKIAMQTRELIGSL